jgi:hypothetical protein
VSQLDRRGRGRARRFTVKSKEKGRPEKWPPFALVGLFAK